MGAGRLSSGAVRADDHHQAMRERLEAMEKDVQQLKRRSRASGVT